MSFLHVWGEPVTEYLSKLRWHTHTIPFFRRGSISVNITSSPKWRGFDGIRKSRNVIVVVVLKLVLISAVHHPKTVVLVVHGILECSLEFFALNAGKKIWWKYDEPPLDLVDNCWLVHEKTTGHILGHTCTSTIISLSPSRTWWPRRMKPYWLGWTSSGIRSTSCWGWRDFSELLEGGDFIEDAIPGWLVGWFGLVFLSFKHWDTKFMWLFHGGIVK